MKRELTFLECVGVFASLAFYVAALYYLTGCADKQSKTILDTNGCGWSYELNCYACQIYYKDAVLLSCR